MRVDSSPTTKLDRLGTSMGSELELANVEQSKKIRLPKKKLTYEDEDVAEKQLVQSSSQKDHLRVKRIGEKKQ